MGGVSVALTAEERAICVSLGVSEREYLTELAAETTDGKAPSEAARRAQRALRESYAAGAAALAKEAAEHAAKAREAVALRPPSGRDSRSLRELAKHREREAAAAEAEYHAAACKAFATKARRAMTVEDAEQALLDAQTAEEHAREAARRAGAKIERR